MYLPHTYSTCIPLPHNFVRPRHLEKIIIIFVTLLLSPLVLRRNTLHPLPEFPVRAPHPRYTTVTTTYLTINSTSSNSSSRSTSTASCVRGPSVRGRPSHLSWALYNALYNAPMAHNIAADRILDLRAVIKARPYLWDFHIPNLLERASSSLSPPY